MCRTSVEALNRPSVNELCLSSKRRAVGLQTGGSFASKGLAQAAAVCPGGVLLIKLTVNETDDGDDLQKCYCNESQ